MTPDELVALADASEGVAAYHRGDTDDLADGPTMIQAYAKLKALAPSLARDHADLREWAERAAESLRDPWETVWNVDEAEPERGEQPTIRQKDTSSLLAEYAERWGDT